MYIGYFILDHILDVMPIVFHTATAAHVVLLSTCVRRAGGVAARARTAQASILTLALVFDLIVFLGIGKDPSVLAASLNALIAILV